MSFVISQIDANTDILAFISMPLLCPLSIDSDMHKSIIHGAGEEIYFLSIVSNKHHKGCILVFEYCYFLSQNNNKARNALNIALTEYQQSGTQVIVSNDIQDVIKKHGNNKHTLTSDITDIIINNQMCKLYNIPWAFEHLMMHISKKIFVNNDLHIQYVDSWCMCCSPVIWNCSMIVTVSQIATMKSEVYWVFQTVFVNKTCHWLDQLEYLKIRQRRPKANQSCWFHKW